MADFDKSTLKLVLDTSDFDAKIASATKSVDELASKLRAVGLDPYCDIENQRDAAEADRDNLNQQLVDLGRDGQG